MAMIFGCESTHHDTQRCVLQMPPGRSAKKGSRRVKPGFGSGDPLVVLTVLGALAVLGCDQTFLHAVPGSHLVSTSCGDGVTQKGEECDNGTGNDDYESDACRTNCVRPSCGDAVVDSGEECDDGNGDDGDGCNTDCTAWLWTRQDAGPSGTISGSNDVAIDAAGNVVVTGWESAPGQGKNIWTRKYDAVGNTLWTATYNGPANDNDVGFGVAIDSQGSVVVTGYETFEGQNRNLWLTKYDTDGHQLWSQYYDGPISARDEGRSVAIGPDDSVVVVGLQTVAEGTTVTVVRKSSSAGELCWSSSLFDSNNTSYWGYGVAFRGEGLSEILVGITSSVIRLDANGRILQQIIDLGNNVLIGKLAIANRGEILLVGSTNYDEGSSDIVAYEFDSTGHRKWVVIHDGHGHGTDRGMDITADFAGNVLVTGIESVPGQGENIWVGKYDSAGNPQWHRAVDVGGTTDIGWGIAADSDANVVVAGQASLEQGIVENWVRKYMP